MVGKKDEDDVLQRLEQELREARQGQSQAEADSKRLQLACSQLQSKLDKADAITSSSSSSSKSVTWNIAEVKSVNPKKKKQKTAAT